MSTMLTIMSVSCTDVTAPTSVGELTITPVDTATLLLGPGGGQQMQFVATASARDGTAKALQNVVWRTTADGVVAIASDGVATARGLGEASIIARVGAMYDSARVIVRRVPVASLVIALDTIALEIGPFGSSTRTLSTVARDSLGHRLNADVVQWSATDLSVAAVTPHGVLTAVGLGETWVHAAADAERDSSVVMVTATLGPASRVHVTILGAQWTQGVQRSDGSIPMISGGRAAVVNVTTSATGSITTPTQFVLRLFNERGVPVHSDTTSVSILSGSSTNREPTLQFLVPADVLRLGLRWDIVRDPGRLSPGGAEGAETYPESGRAQLHLVTTPTLRIRFVPIVLAAHHDERGEVTPALLEYYLRTVRALFPHGRIDATIGPAHRTAVRFGVAGYGGDAAFWATVVGELDTRRVADVDFADAYWVGVVRPPSGFTYSTYGGIAYIPADGHSYGPGTRTSAVIGAKWSQNESQSRDLVAHELGHNLGRLHAPCGTNGAVDLSFPDSRGVIGEGAHDTFAWELGSAVGAIAVPGGTADFMGYCSPTWISAHSYHGMLAFRAAPLSALRAPSVRQRVLLVRGTVESGAPRLDTPVNLEAVPSTPNPAGAWLLEGRAEDGALIFQWRFSLARWDHAPRMQPFAIALPLDTAMSLRLAAIRVTGPSGNTEWIHSAKSTTGASVRWP